MLQTKWKEKNVDTFKSTVHVFCLIDGLIGGLVGWLD